MSRLTQSPSAVASGTRTSSSVGQSHDPLAALRSTQRMSAIWYGDQRQLDVINATKGAEERLERDVMTPGAAPSRISTDSRRTPVSDWRISRRTPGRPTPRRLTRARGQSQKAPVQHVPFRQTLGGCHAQREQERDAVDDGGGRPAQRPPPVAPRQPFESAHDGEERDQRQAGLVVMLFGRRRPRRSVTLAADGSASTASPPGAFPGRGGRGRHRFPGGELDCDSWKAMNRPSSRTTGFDARNPSTSEKWVSLTESRPVPSRSRR